MSKEDKPSLTDLVGKITAGVGNLGRKKQGQDAADRTAEPTIELGGADDELPPRSDGLDDIDEPNEPLPEETAAQPPKKTNPIDKLTKGQKLIGGILLVAVVIFAKGQMDSPSDKPAPAKTEATQQSNNATEEGMAFGTEPAGVPETEPATVQKDDLALPLAGPGATGEHNQVPLTEASVPFQPAPDQPSPQPAFGGADQPLSTPADHAGASPNLAAETSEPFTPGQTEQANPFGGSAPTASHSEEPKSSEPAPGNQPPVFTGTTPANPDSGAGKETPVEQVALAKTNADVAAQAEQIAALEKKLNKVEADLKEAQAKQAKPTPVQHRVVAKATAKTQQPRAKASPVAATNARPRICVKAIAEAARNCSTCVAHAFIVRGGGEDMVGQGDFLDGYRVSIVGDRLDLQDKNGQVAHKFWSATNGCGPI
ncbi:hypothetical protein ACQCLI_32355 (plasmid) [Pseudomonas nitroreducens]|uniref:hypothetical protein n=1 Tax=Pseudomonas nitroreducens TaxID=46680 RepID=UPI00037323A6|nr:hypothetical protein [Pseudomonas nitroreducens]